MYASTFWFCKFSKICPLFVIESDRMNSPNEQTWNRFKEHPPINTTTHSNNICKYPTSGNNFSNWKGTRVLFLCSYLSFHVFTMFDGVLFQLATSVCLNLHFIPCENGLIISLQCLLQVPSMGKIQFWMKLYLIWSVFKWQIKNRSNCSSVRTAHKIQFKHSRESASFADCLNIYIYIHLPITKTVLWLKWSMQQLTLLNMVLLSVFIKMWDR